MLIFLHKIIYLKESEYLFTRKQFSKTIGGYRINAARYKKQVSEGHFYINATRSWYQQLPPEIQLKSNIM